MHQMYRRNRAMLSDGAAMQEPIKPDGKGYRPERKGAAKAVLPIGETFVGELLQRKWQMIVNIKDIEGKEMYWYEDPLSWMIIIGVRGIGEFKINRWDAMRAEDTFRIRQGRHWTEKEAIQWAISYTERESEYIDFEEVPNNILMLSEPRQTKPNNIL